MNIRRRFLGFLGLALAGALPACADEASDPCSDVPGTACTWAGEPGPTGFNEDVRHRKESWLGWPTDLTFAPDGRAWIVDWNNHRLRRVEADDTLVTMIGNAAEGDGAPGFADLLPLGDPAGAPGPAVSLNHPTDVEFLPDGDAVIAAWHNNKIRVWDAETGIVKVIAGTDYGYRGDDGPAYMAMFDLPKSVAIDERGAIHLVDQRNQRIRTIEPDGERTIRTTIGIGEAGYAGDGGLAIDAQIAMDETGTIPEGALAMDDRYLYLADSSNNRIRRVERATGLIDCIAGDGEAGHDGDGAAAVDASLHKPLDLEVGPDGRLYVADTMNNVIRAIDLETGTIEHVAGSGAPCPRTDVCLEEVDGGPASDLVLNNPYGLAFDAAGNLYVADTYNNRIVRVARDW